MRHLINTEITYTSSTKDINWEWLKQRLNEDNFDNGRTPEQYATSFENSFAVVFAWSGGEIIGKARVLSDGICNAYVVDVWTYSRFRKQGIASKMLEILESKLQGQHVYLFTDDSVSFYEKSGYQIQATGLGKVIGSWLKN
ncbi:MAG: GNAT family N-acetyltransferase [Chloroflexota bacterium]